MRNQIRIVQIAPRLADRSRPSATEWMEASLSNKWLLRTRLAEALQAHGKESHRLEMRSIAADPHAAQLFMVRPETGSSPATHGQAAAAQTCPA